MGIDGVYVCVLTRLVDPGTLDRLAMRLPDAVRSIVILGAETIFEFSSFNPATRCMMSRADSCFNNTMFKFYIAKKNDHDRMRSHK